MLLNWSRYFSYRYFPTKGQSILKFNRRCRGYRGGAWYILSLNYFNNCLEHNWYYEPLCSSSASSNRKIVWTLKPPVVGQVRCAVSKCLTCVSRLFKIWQILFMLYVLLHTMPLLKDSISIQHRIAALTYFTTSTQYSQIIYIENHWSKPISLLKFKTFTQPCMETWLTSQARNGSRKSFPTSLRMR